MVKDNFTFTIHYSNTICERCFMFKLELDATAMVWNSHILRLRNIDFPRRRPCIACSVAVCNHIVVYEPNFKSGVNFIREDLCVFIISAMLRYGYLHVMLSSFEPYHTCRSNPSVIHYEMNYYNVPLH